MASTHNLPIYSPQYSFESPRHQEFPLPNSFLEYISQNGAVYEKLIQTCKYFFAHHQLVPMENIDFDISSKPFWLYNNFNCHLFKDGIGTDLKKVKLFIYGCIKCWTKSPSDLFSLFSKSVYRCTPTDLWLYRQDIEIKDFAKVSANVKFLKLFDTTFSYPDKTEASLWDILALMPKLETFENLLYIKNSLLSFTKHATIPLLPKLKKFTFSKVPKDDFPVIAEFIKLHPNTKFQINIIKNNIKSGVKAFKAMLKETFPNTSIIQNKEKNRCEFLWTLKSQHVRIVI